MKRRILALVVLFLGISWANYYQPQARFFNVPFIIILMLSVLVFLIISTPKGQGDNLDKKHLRLLILTYAAGLIPITARVILYYNSELSYLQKLLILAPCAYLILIPAWFYSSFENN